MRNNIILFGHYSRVELDESLLCSRCRTVEINGEKKNHKIWVVDFLILFFFTIDLLFCNSWFEWKFYRPNIFLKKNHLTSWIHQLAIQSCKCSFGDIYQNLQTECCFFCNVSIKKDPMIHYAICSDTLLTLMMLNSHVFDFTVHAWETPICLQCNSYWHSHLMGNQHFSVTRGGWQQIVQSR